MIKNNLRRFYGQWNLTDLGKIPKNGLSVFSCFHCGGGSTMGYKLAGFDVIGGVEIDPEMMAIYRENHTPKYSYLMGVQQFKELPLDELPDEIKQLDVLDGSPPCSVFSTAGKRQKKWGSKHHFREGQKKQRLDDLFMHFIEVGQRLQPKVIMAENVKGLIIGNAKGYVKEIFAAFCEAGYEAQLFLFNAARMGVPQARERTFFIARQRDLKLKPLIMNFNENYVKTKDAVKSCKSISYPPLGAETKKLWESVGEGRPLSDAHKKGSRFSEYKTFANHPAHTISASSSYYHWSEPRYLSDYEIVRIQSFPDDYNFLGKDVQYVCGMSVPPFMMQRIALEIGRQWFGIEYDQ